MDEKDNSCAPGDGRAQDDDESRAADTRRPLAAIIAAVPIILVNTLAVIGQCQWASTHLHWGRPGQALFAGALEATALAVMYLAHTALIEGDSAWRQKMFAYLIACGSASVNWQEHSNNWQPTPPAFVFAGASLLSPILWATYSKFAARIVMRAAGLIDKRAAKFSLARWVMFPRKTFKALRYSVWFSVQSPAEAIDGSRDANGTPAVNDKKTKTAKRERKTANGNPERQRELEAPTANETDGNANTPPDPTANGNGTGGGNATAKGRTDNEWIEIAKPVYIRERDRLSKRPPEKPFWAALVAEVDQLTAAGRIPASDEPPSLGTAKRVRGLVEDRFPELASRIHPVAS